MLDREKRLNEVYEFLRNNFGIHTKSDFADSIKYARAYISSALNGNKRYLTDKLFANICDAFPGVFNLDYLLTGHGSLLVEQVIHDEDNIRITESIDPSSLVNAALAAKDETIAVMREQIEAKDALIASLRQQIELLKQTTADHSKNATFMVADSHENPK